MTDINRIIEVLQERKVCALCVDGSDENCFKCKLAEGMTSSEIIDSFDAAIQAVQEKAKRDKGCGYCNMMLNEKSQLHQVLRGYPANCCINCGRKLGE